MPEWLAVSCAFKKNGITVETLPSPADYATFLPLTYFNRKCLLAHFLVVFPYLWLVVRRDRGQQVQHGQHGTRVDDHHVR